MADQEILPRRSVLYMPSSNERALEKAKSLPCDALILDLEDAVAPEAKEAAREAACAAAASGEYGRRELTIRVNAVGTPWHEADLAAACAAGPDAIVVPKVGSGEQVRSIVAAMEKHGAPGIERFIANVQDWDEVVACHALTGDMDYLLQVYVRDLEHFSRFLLDRLLNASGVADVNSSFVLRTVKASSGLPLPG